MSDDEPSSETRTDVSRRDVLGSAGAMALGSTPLFVGGTGVADGAVSDGPSGVHVAFGSDPASTLRVGWSGGPATEALVRYGRPGDLDTTVQANARTVPGEDALAYSATLAGLASDTTYVYEAEMDGTAVGPFSIRTAPEENESFRVTAVGDHGIADPENPFQRADTDDPIEVIDRAQAQEPAFHLAVGDISYANGKPSTWELYFEEFEEFYATTPFLTVPGNHEAEPGTGLAQYDGRLNDLMPIYDPGLNLASKQRWYDFQYGNTLFMGLNTTSEDCGLPARGDEAIPIYDTRCRTDEQKRLNQAQRDYIEKTLAAAAEDPDVKWKVVYLHGPLWTDAPDHPSRKDLRERWGTLFDEYGVDLVMSGDNHVYERTKPIVGTDFERGFGTTYVTNGTVGASHYAFENAEPADFLAARSNEFFGVTQLDVDDERIAVQYVTEDGSIEDEFAVIKDENGRPTQATIEDAKATELAVSGTRTDDGSAFTGGQTNQVDLSVQANRPVRVRDRVPAEWNVLERGDVTDTEAGPEGVTYVYFDDDRTADPQATYFVEAPDGLTKTGRYDFGPIQVYETEGSAWVDVAGTASVETVVGEDTNV